MNCPEPRRRRPSPAVLNHDCAEVAAATTAPSPKRRRVVQPSIPQPKAVAQTATGRLRETLAAFTREHLPLLGDLVCPYLERLECPSQASPELPGECSLPYDELAEFSLETVSPQSQGKVELLRAVSSFLLEAAGDTLGEMLLDDGLITNLINSRRTASSQAAIQNRQRLGKPPFDFEGTSRGSLSSSPTSSVTTVCQQEKQPQLQQQVEEGEASPLLRLLQRPLPSRTSWSHGVFFKYAFVDLDFECLATFRICLCHHPLFIFYREHEKGLHVLHVDGTLLILHLLISLRFSLTSDKIRQHEQQLPQFLRLMQVFSTPRQMQLKKRRVRTLVLNACSGSTCKDWKRYTVSPDTLACLP